jgi:exosortase
VTTATLTLGRAYAAGEWKRFLPAAVTGAAFVALFWSPMNTLIRDWWGDPDAGHGLLLAPLALYLGWKRGLVENPKGQVAAGIAILLAAVLLRYVSGLAAELFTMRASMLGALFGLVVFHLGLRQLLHWWLPASLLVLSVPLPDVVLGSIALPLQFRASVMGAELLEWRHVPVRLSGNVIQLPGRSLFVTEACSGLRSLASLISLGLLIGGLWLRHPASRVLLILSAIPVAMFLNGIRVFLTGFLVYYVDPKLGEGFMHLTEGWIIFVVAFAVLGGVAALLNQAEILVGRRGA